MGGHRLAGRISTHLGEDASKPYSAKWKAWVSCVVWMERTMRFAVRIAHRIGTPKEISSQIDRFANKPGPREAEPLEWRRAG